MWSTLRKKPINRDEVLVSYYDLFEIKPLVRQDAQDTLLRGIHLMRDFPLNHWLSSGTLLGLYRDGDLISHDTDLDVNIMLNWNDGRMNDIDGAFTSAGFKIVRTIKYQKKMMQTAFMDKRNGVIFDVYAFYPGIEDEFALNVNDYGVIRKPLRFIEELNKITWDGFSFPVPNCLDEFLVWRYGKNWKTPKDSKQPWVEDAAHLEKWND